MVIMNSHFLQVKTKGEVRVIREGAIILI
jgi:hypothetical protein